METSSPSDRGIRRLETRQIGALPLVEPILAALAVRQTVNDLVTSEADVDLGQSVVLLVLNRLLAPRPLDGIQDWLAGTVLPEVLGVRVSQAYDNRFGRALDGLHPQLGELWRRIVSRAIQVYELDLTALHWDLTSIDFEGAYVASQLAAYGYSRDQRPDTKQINLEVAVTHEGAVPLLYQVLTGNTADISRSLPHVTALRTFLARPELAERHLRPLLISDCKLLTPESVWACHEEHLYYLAPLADGTASEAALRSVTAAELAAQPLAYRPQRTRPADWTPCQGVWRPFTFETSHGPVTDRVLVVWSAGHPLFVHRDERIEGLVWVSLLALLVRTLLERQAQQHGLATTAERLCQRLATLQAVDITWADGQVERRLAERTPDQAALLCTLGCPQPTVYTQLGAPLA